MTSSKAYRLGGIAAAIAGTMLDYYSTLPSVKMFNDPRFRGKGLDRKYGEANLFFGKHLTVDEFKRKSLILKIGMSVLASIFPEAGYFYLGISPLIVANNRRARKQLERELEA